MYSSKRQPSSGERYLECRNYSADRPRGQGCPIRGKRTAPFYEALVAEAFLALGPFRELPEDSRVAEARVRLAERRRIIEDLYIESRDRATYDTRRAALDAEEATLPVPLPLAAGFITELARGQELWRAGAASVRERNALLRSSFARVVITGRECAIEPVPLLARLSEATERARVVGVG